MPMKVKSLAPESGLIGSGRGGVDLGLKGFLSYAEDYWRRRQEMGNIPSGLGQSIEYSLFQTGGKRFRPQLCWVSGQNFILRRQMEIVDGHQTGTSSFQEASSCETPTSPSCEESDLREFYPWALAVEFIHTYSLIHDDLPSMDNDDYRRGSLTNHKVFGEASALLAGDGLLTEAFVLLAHEYSMDPPLVLDLVKLLGLAAGASGMVGGQYLDLGLDLTTTSKRETLENRDRYTLIHQKKTGALIQVCLLGAGRIAQLDSWRMEKVKEFGQHLGLAFQLADDLIDGTLPAFLGADGVHRLLEKTSLDALACLTQMGVEDSELSEMVRFNWGRASECVRA